VATCPNCGVAVAKGYPRCPKCQATLPVVRLKRATFREENLEGGTTMAAPEGAAASRASWIAAIALLVIGAGIAVYFATRGGAPREPVGTTEPDEPVADDDDTDETPTQGVEPDQPAARRNPTGEPRAYTAKQVMTRIDDELRTERLWAKVTSDDDVLVIESALCAEPGVKQVLSGEADGLRAAGFSTVRCQSPNGQPVFEDRL
jgi:hypothetical protein